LLKHVVVGGGLPEGIPALGLDGGGAITFPFPSHVFDGG